MIQYTPSVAIYLRSFLIISSHLYQHILGSIFPSVSWPQHCMHLRSISCKIHATHLILPDWCSTNSRTPHYAVFSSLLFFINFGQIFSPASCSLPPWNLTVCSSPNVKDQVSHSYKTTCKIMVPFNTYMFLDSRPGQKMLSWILASITAF